MGLRRPALLLLTLTALTSGACAARTSPGAAAPPVPATVTVASAQPALPRVPAASPLLTLLAASEAAATRAQAALTDGHLENARAGFNEALDILRFQPHRGARMLEKVIKSALGNAEHKQASGVDDLVVVDARVDQGPMFKRIRPRARGMAFGIKRRTSHNKVALDSAE